MNFFQLLVIAVIIGMTLYGLSITYSRWQANNQQPVLSVPAEVVTKRTKVRGYGPADSARTRTYYYSTFEEKTGDRHEFRISGSDYGQLAEGDEGTLTYQGSRYLGFERRSKAWTPSP